MFIEKQIRNIEETDSRIMTSGFVVNKEENNFILEDNSSQLKVIFDNTTTVINIGDYVRVFGNILQGEDIVLQAQIIQNLNNIDKKLHQKLLMRL
ncbi:MAG: hypothetical protein PHD81_00985 [Candidatus Nanoarchaeia archaeon]|nr:hypothetical protein [Candidatus Nanoarchaeia archaeon]MDD5587665.1 hypothetical protein [Candidatus Nanoarchaeia archaeon]